MKEGQRTLEDPGYRTTSPRRGPEEEEPAILRVSELSERIARLFDTPLLQDIRVRGEVTNFRRHLKGHCYFSLSDQGSESPALVPCVMWRSDAARLGFEPTDGMEVVVQGSVGHYAPQGKYQMYVRAIRPAGAGDRFLLVERWKRELEAEGLFDAGRKVPLPLFPGRIGVVTSATGAVLQDIRNVLSRRFPVEIILSQTAVQGESAHMEIAEAIRRIDGCADVIIVCRGGGSYEDLFPFNHPDVVRAVAACRTPVVSAVGHEVDTTLCDYAADLRAPTPSAAAEMVVPDRRDLLAELRDARGSMQLSLIRRCSDAREETLELGERLDSRRITRVLTEKRQWTADTAERIFRQVSARVTQERLAIASLRASLGGVNPERLLGLGYSIVTRDGTIIRSAGTLTAGDRLVIRFARGRAHVRVEGCDDD